MFLYVWLVVFGVLIVYFRQVYSHFNRYGVKHATPIPPLGTIWRILFQIEHNAHNVVRNYNAFPNERFIGTYEFLKPIVLVRDIELIKQITMKDYEHFLDHRTVVSDQGDHLFGRNVFSLKGQEWKDMRSTLSPAFTSSKMKMMLPFMVEVGDQMILALEKQINASPSKYIELDAFDLATRYANDVIASCAFGLRVDSHNDRENNFYKMSRSFNTFNFKQLIKILMFSSFPTIMTKLKTSVFSNEEKDFIHTLVMETMKDREARNIIRPDLIHLLMEVKKGKLYHERNTTKDADAGFATIEESPVGTKVNQRTWSDNDLIAQATAFFSAGFETISTAIAFLLHELAVNPDVQDRLYQEIKEFDTKTGGKLDHSVIQQMTYMDMVISEALRFRPAAVALDRVCTKDYNLGKPNPGASQDYIIRKGEGVHIALMGIHNDPKYFPNPNKFDPERFSEKNKHNIQPCSYMPFGLGPRSCIGTRFALYEMKVMTYKLLRVLELSPCERTQLKARLSPRTGQLRFRGGHWLRIKLRE